MKVRVIRVIEMVGEDNWIDDTLSKSIGSDSFKCTGGTIVEVVRIKEKVEEGQDDDKRV